MKKVGILSMQRIKNYGSFLQAYALKKMIEGLGYDVQFVDYHVDEPLIKEEKAKNILFKGLDALREDAPLIQKIQYIIHKKNFGKKYYSMLGLTDSPNYNPKLDTLVIGSDEVFNCIQSNKNVGYSMELFGKDNNAQSLISYAASFGNTTLEKIKKYDKQEEISLLLKNFDSISVRDKNSYDIAKRLSGKNVNVNLDPVLIFDYMKNIEIPNIKENEKYMIVYAYSGRISRMESEKIKEYAKNKGLKVYAIGGAQSCADKFIDCSPFEVLAYFKNAECIITDTFHGSIFSIITKKNFITLVRKSVGNLYGNEEKLVDLLERLKLTSRIIYNIDDIDKISRNKIDYIEVDNILKKQRKLTEKYLRENL